MAIDLPPADAQSDPADKHELFSILKARINVVQNKMWAIDSHAIDTAVRGVVDSLVELGSLPAPAPKAGKYYDNAYADLAAKGGL